MKSLTRVVAFSPKNDIIFVFRQIILTHINTQCVFRWSSTTCRSFHVQALLFFFYGGSLMYVASQTAWRNSPLSSACLPASTVETPIHSPMSCAHLLLGLPLPLLPSHVPSKNSFSNVLCRLIWPKYDDFCFLIRFKSCGTFTPSCSRTLAFVFSQSMKFWVSSGSISSRKKLSFSRRSLRWSKPRSHRLQQEKCRP